MKMSFLLRVPKRAEAGYIEVSEAGDWEAKRTQTAIFMRESAGGNHVQRAQAGPWAYFAIEDFIASAAGHQSLSDFCQDFSPPKITAAGGNFYLIAIGRDAGTVRVFNSLLGILPVYWFEDADSYWVASRADAIVRASGGAFRLNKKYLIEHLLFGYGFQDATLFAGIRLLPANHFIEIKAGRLELLPHTRITDWYVDNPSPWRAALAPLSELFIERAANYLPQEPYYSSLTGGLDGRTLLAIGLGLGRQVTTYSYGLPTDKDVSIPQKIAQDLGIPYRPFLLDERFARDHFLDHARRGNALAEGHLRFSRAAYHFLSEQLKGQTRHLVSGNFGSELMRTMRGAGNVISPAALTLFEAKSEAEIAAKLAAHPRLRFLRLDALRPQLEELIEECILYRKSLDRGLTLNQQFYVYMLEEVFRKYFGAEIVLEQHYLASRTPFLDAAFMQALFKTELAGCNAAYREDSPLERYKGQILYPHIIKRTFPALLQPQLDRGYAPGDFLSLAGKLRIAYGYLRKRMAQRGRDLSVPDYGEGLFADNRQALAQIKSDYQFMDQPAFTDFMNTSKWKAEFVHFNLYISLLDYLERVFQDLSNVELD
jgi:asparagine synthase (glutamine-hydrolysing)